MGNDDLGVGLRDRALVWRCPTSGTQRREGFDEEKYVTQVVNKAYTGVGLLKGQYRKLVHRGK